MDIVLGLDVGTSLSKAGFFRLDGRPAGAMLSVPTPIASDGTADAETLVTTVEDLVERLCTALPEDPRGRPATVQGCALTCSWHGLAGLDQPGRPCTRLSTWMDASAADEALELRRRVADEVDLHDRTGCRLHPSYVPARLLRLKTQEPGSWQKVRRWVSIGELLQARWCGPDSPCSFSMASGSGLFDSRSFVWDPELCDLIGVASGTLPRVSDELRSLTQPYRRRWPVLSEASWTPAWGDGASSVIGTGVAMCTRQPGFGRGNLPGGPGSAGGAAALTVGTSAAARLLVERGRRLAQPLRPALFAYLLDESSAVVGVARSNALNLVRWAERTLRLAPGRPGEDIVTRLARERTPGSSGLSACPSFAGERSPDWPAAARGAVEGLSLTSEPLDILQALAEAVVIGLVDAVDELERWAGPLDLVLSGGAVRSPGWQQLVVEGFGRRMAVSDAADTSLSGAALLCLQRLGLLEYEHVCAPPMHLIEPDPSRADAFSRLARRSRRI